MRPRNISVPRIRPGKVGKLDPLRGTPFGWKHPGGIETSRTHHQQDDASAQFSYGSGRGPPTVFVMIPKSVYEIPPVTDAGANPRQRGPGLCRNMMDEVVPHVNVIFSRSPLIAPVQLPAPRVGPVVLVDSFPFLNLPFHSKAFGFCILILYAIKYT